MRTTLRLPAPAKLNLCLHVTAQRDDGYHELETLFQLLDFGDEVELAVTAEPEIRRIGDVAGVSEEEDLSIRAARLLAEQSKPNYGAQIRIDKRLPLGGGLGGGSSDAASVLVGLNYLWKLGLREDELAALGLQLGADVPIFVHGYSAFARGVGEELHAVNIAPQWYLVLWPPIFVSTGAIFSSSTLTRDTSHLKIGGFPWNLETEAGLERFWARTHNDCEPVVREREPAVAATIDWLANYAPTRMSGTGACAFARFSTREEAEGVLGRLEQAPQASGRLGGFIARGVDCSPMRVVMDGLGC